MTHAESVAQRRAEELHATRQWPFFDIALHVDCNVRVPEPLATRLDEFLDNSVPGLRNRGLCRATLHWAALCDAEPEKVRHHEDPFEPLLLLFERGGGFSVENGTADFALLRVPIGTWDSHASAAPYPAP